MTEFTPWTLFVDIGIISTLLLVGKLMRVKLKFMQKLFIPPSLVAGFLGLALGPNGLDVLPLSHNMGTYAGILIAFVFGALPLASERSSGKGKGMEIGHMWAYSQAGMLLQWAFGGFLGLLILNQIWDLNPAFGITMSGGFCGGHGTAAAIGQAFSTFGYDEILTLAMTAATVGIVAAIIVGLILVRWAAKRKHTQFITDFADLPDELRTGLVPEEKRESMGESTCSSISIDSLTFNLVMVAFVAFGGYLLSKGVSSFFPKLELPVFSCAFVVAIIVKKLFDRTKVSGYICPQTVGHISGAFTDFLVAFGIASIKLEIVLLYIVPLSILLVSGLAFTLFFVLYLGRKLMRDYWFEKSIFTWGWFTGTMAMGIALLRIVDPKMQSQSLQSYALAYLFIAPVEIALITFAPLAFVNGYGLLFLSICLAGGLAILLFARLKGWFQKTVK